MKSVVKSLIDMNQIGVKTAQELNDIKPVHVMDWVKALASSLVLLLMALVLLRMVGFPMGTVRALSTTIQSVLFIGCSLFFIKKSGVDLKKVYLENNVFVFGCLKKAFLYFIALNVIGLLIVSVTTGLDALLSRSGIGDNQFFESVLFPEAAGFAGYLHAGLSGPAWSVFLCFVSFCVLAPIGEELLFRRLLFRSLRVKLNLTAALFISSLLFGLMHGAQFPVVFVKSLLLGYSYEKDGRLLTVIFLHSFVNAAALALALFGLTG